MLCSSAHIENKIIFLFNFCFLYFLKENINCVKILKIFKLIGCTLVEWMHEPHSPWSYSLKKDSAFQDYISMNSSIEMQRRSFKC